MDFLFVLTLLPALTKSEVRVCKIKTSQKNGCFNVSPTPCFMHTEAKVCHKEFGLVTIDIRPYTTVLTEIVTKMILKACCGDCVKFALVKQYPTTETYLRDTITQQVNFIFPVLNKNSAPRMYGYDFVPLLDVSAGYFVTLDEYTTKIKGLMMSCLGLWPLPFVGLLMTFIAGFFAWILDKNSNPGDFPKEFVNGVSEGFWWSFVSMTTVGYGDKTTHSWPARALAIVWILIGITTCSLLTASLTSAVNSIGQKPDMRNKKVGILQNRIYDELFVLKKGSFIVQNNSEVLKKMLYAHEIDGIFMDWFTLNHYIPNKEGYIITEESYDGDRMAYGILVPLANDSLYLSEFIEDHKLVLELCMEEKYNGKIKSKDAAVNVLSIEGGIFWPSFIACMVVIFLIGVYGLIYEFHRKKKRVAKVDVVENEEGFSHHKVDGALYNTQKFILELNKNFSGEDKFVIKTIKVAPMERKESKV